jgi:pimeloyl-ACP methyl ester carboxylesterase
MDPAWKQADAVVAGVRLHYYRAGRAGRRPLMLVHGFSDNGLCWTPVARALADDYDIVMPDLRGHGLSERLGPGGAPDMAADLAGLIRALGMDRPIVVGHSMGSMAAYRLGLGWPELVSGLALEDPPWRLSAPPAAPAAGAAEPPIVQWAKSLADVKLDELLAGYGRDHPDWPADLVAAMAESKKQLDQGIINTLSVQLESLMGVWKETIASLKPPTLLIAGDPALGGMVDGPALAKIRELNPAIQTVRIAGAGHLIRFDRFSEFMAALRPFLASLAAGA